MNYLGGIVSKRNVTILSDSQAVIRALSSKMIKNSEGYQIHIVWVSEPGGLEYGTCKLIIYNAIVNSVNDTLMAPNGS